MREVYHNQITLSNAIKIWSYSDAPEKYQGYCGGDEDYVIFIPKNADIPAGISMWMDAYCTQAQIDIDDGVAYTLAHA